MRASALFFFLTSVLAIRHASADCTLQITSNGAIGPGTYDYIERALERGKNCSSILYLINTPGGSLQSTRLIVEKILNSPKPFLCLVYPTGAHAGSAGAIILQACHVNGAMEATNLGAATPISMGGEMNDDMRKKIVNDTVSWMEGLVELRGRNKQFAKDIVVKASAVDSLEAKKIGAIDVVPKSIDDFLEFAKNREVKLSKGERTKVQTDKIEIFNPDARFTFLDLVTHPQVAYLIFMASLALLYFELTHPGMIAPGVFGALGLVTSLISFHMLEVRWAGVVLILLGIGFMIAELFVTSFGALGIGGIVAFVAGSLLMFDPAVGSLPLGLVLPSAIGLGLAFLGIGALAMSAQKSKVKNTDLVGQLAVVSRLNHNPLSGKVEIQGEIWNFESKIPLQVGDRVKVLQMSGLKLIVVKEDV